MIDREAIKGLSRDELIRYFNRLHPSWSFNWRGQETPEQIIDAEIYRDEHPLDPDGLHYG